MGDTGSMLLGLLLAYGPIASIASLDNNILINYDHSQPVDRFATILPLLLPAAILIIPYTDLLLAVIRRTLAGKSPFAADRMHLHHRLQNLGHSHRQTVLLMYLWAALFSSAVVGLSVLRVPLVWLAVVTVAAVIALLLATMPTLRPWRSTGKRAAGTRRRQPARASRVRSPQPSTPAVAPAAPTLGAAPEAAPLFPAPVAAPSSTVAPSSAAPPEAARPAAPRPAMPPRRHARNAGATRP
jgi:UDP-GlcNAc:undecaprenyl-phosphate GlcNAc-1-phosphate transferase